MKRPSLLLGILLLVSSLAACGSDAASTPASSPTKTVPVSTPTPTREVITSPLVGMYSWTITKQDIASMPDRSVDVGRYTMTFKDDGTYMTLGSNGFSVIGQYQVSQDELTITDSTCGPQTGTYRWMLKGSMLLLQAIGDGCVDRKFSLTTHPLVRQGS